MVSQAIAPTRSFLAVARTSTRRATGTIIAPPMPCTKRDSTNSSRLSDMAQNIEPTTNTPSAQRKTRLAPNRSAIQPETGMKMASATK
jgi:hypothetical protein